MRLFDRDQRRVALTIAGQVVLDEARQVLRDAEVAMHAARNARDHAVSRLRIGYLPDSLPAQVARAVRQLGTAAPAVDVRFETGPALALLEALRGHRLDAVVTSLPAPANGLRMTRLDY